MVDLVVGAATLRSAAGVSVRHRRTHAVSDGEASRGQRVATVNTRGQRAARRLAIGIGLALRRASAAPAAAICVVDAAVGLACVFARVPGRNGTVHRITGGGACANDDDESSREKEGRQRGKFLQGTLEYSGSVRAGKQVSARRRSRARAGETPRCDTRRGRFPINV